MPQAFIFLLLILFLNPFWAKKIAIIKVSQNLTILRKPDPPALDLPIWQSGLCIFYIGVLFGICSPYSDGINSNFHVNAPILFIKNLALTWSAFAVNFVLIVLLLRRREDVFSQVKPQGLMGVISASQLITVTFYAALSFSGASLIITAVIGAYSVMVCAKAITDHVSKTSLGSNFCIVASSAITTLVCIKFLSAMLQC